MRVLELHDFSKGQSNGSNCTECMIDAVRVVTYVGMCQLTSLKFSV
jgi:hypothetical protein